MKQSVEDHTIRGCIIDLDGVIWRGEKLLPGVVLFLTGLQDRGIPYMFATNNATTTPEKMCEKAQKLGFDMRLDQIITSSHAAVNLLRQQLPEEGNVFVIGEEGLLEALINASFQIAFSAENVRAVVVGLDRKVTWDKMAEAAYAIAQGAIFLGTNSDPSFPTERGLAPGNGAILHALQQTTGVIPIVVGKPEPFIFLQALDHMGIEPSHTLVVGDRLTTDIQGGINTGALTALLLTGVTSPKQLAESSIQPHFVFEDLEDLVRNLWCNPEKS